SEYAGRRPSQLVAGQPAIRRFRPGEHHRNTKILYRPAITAEVGWQVTLDQVLAYRVKLIVRLPGITRTRQPLSPRGPNARDLSPIRGKNVETYAQGAKILHQRVCSPGLSRSFSGIALMWRHLAVPPIILWVWRVFSCM